METGRHRFIVSAQQHEVHAGPRGKIFKGVSTTDKGPFKVSKILHPYQGTLPLGRGGRPTAKIQLLVMAPTGSGVASAHPQGNLVEPRQARQRGKGVSPTFE